MDTAPLLDTRTLPAFDRHARVLAAFDALPVGGALTLLSDHDPLGLYFDFETQRHGCFAWRYTDEGPHQWRVQIERLPVDKPAAGHECCNCACSGR